MATQKLSSEVMEIVRLFSPSFEYQVRPSFSALCLFCASRIFTFIELHIRTLFQLEGHVYIAILENVHMHLEVH